jgi:phosphatidate cytidylyltransferase
VLFNITLELQKRIITSICLISLLVLMFFYTFILIVSLIVIAIICWVEFYALISKILVKDNFKDKVLRFFYKMLSLLYLSTIVYLVVSARSENSELEIIISYSILVSVMSDIGGLIVGKIIKGRKLTKVSPNKTVSGSIGSFVFSILLIPFFINYLSEYNFLILFTFTIVISLISQIGDLFISFLKRKAKVKNTSDLLPGHGGILDRVDGIIFAIPTGLLIFNYF